MIVLKTFGSYLMAYQYSQRIKKSMVITSAIVIHMHEKLYDAINSRYFHVKYFFPFFRMHIKFANYRIHRSTVVVLKNDIIIHELKSHLKHCFSEFQDRDNIYVTVDRHTYTLYSMTHWFVLLNSLSYIYSLSIKKVTS